MTTDLRTLMLEAMMLIEMMDGDTSGIHVHGFSDHDLSWGAHQICNAVAYLEPIPSDTAAMLEKIHAEAENWLH